MPKSAALCNRPAASRRNTANRGKIRAVDRPHTSAGVSALQPKPLRANYPSDLHLAYHLTYIDIHMPPALPDDLFAYLDSLGIAHQTVWHDAVFTVEEAQTQRDRDHLVGGFTKNLFLRDKKGSLFLVVAPEDAAIELKSLHRLLGATGRFSFASAEAMRELLGVEFGDALCGDQRQGRASDGGARCRHDGAGGAQLSPLGEYRHHDDFA
jgi:Aminoacyl-tRNA editing domain